jgi:hypothetical protein
VVLTKNIPAANRVYGSSLKAAHSTMGPALLGGSLCLAKMMQVSKHASCTKPSALSVQPNPTFGRSCWTIAGKTSPPVALPHATMPMAKLLFLEKYVETKLIIGQKRHPFPRPRHTPCAKNSCQYCVDKDAMNSPRICRTVPRTIICLKYPESVSRPVQVLIKNNKNTWILPTQEISDGGRFSAST